MPVEEQHEWLASLKDIVTFPAVADATYVTLLDTGVSRRIRSLRPPLPAQTGTLRSHRGGWRMSKDTVLRWRVWPYTAI